MLKKCDKPLLAHPPIHGTVRHLSVVQWPPHKKQKPKYIYQPSIAFCPLVQIQTEKYALTNTTKEKRWKYEGLKMIGAGIHCALLICLRLIPSKLIDYGTEQWHKWKLGGGEGMTSNCYLEKKRKDCVVVAGGGSLRREMATLQ
ncbi:hypothetical protein CDAR_546441 [Caerostris darwini]|uniref:Transmembrane protein n=1 Tax=Caerostris darwini TaxID=1538125 RepID=A0AAV4M3J4_9ARAC|nr:hypothetical protein CDAR_546441 [Caerostris darwini]